MKIVKIQYAKNHLSQLIDRAREGEEIIIARGKQPLVRLQPVTGKVGRRKPGSLKGRLRVGPEFFEPLPEGEQEFWK